MKRAGSLPPFSANPWGRGRSVVRMAGLARRLGAVDDPLRHAERLQQAAPGLRGEHDAGQLFRRRDAALRQRTEDERIEVDLWDVAAELLVDGVDELVGD